MLTQSRFDRLCERLSRHPGALEMVRSTERNSVLEGVVGAVAVDVMDLKFAHDHAALTVDDGGALMAEG